MIRSGTWARRRLGDAALPPGWQMGANGTPQFTGYSADLLLVRDGQGNTVAIPEGINAANWTAAQNAVNAGTMTIAQVAAQYGVAAQSTAAPPPAPPVGVVHADPIISGPILLPAASTTTPPAAQPIDMGATPQTSFLDSVPTWAKWTAAAGPAYFFLLRK